MGAILSFVLGLLASTPAPDLAIVHATVVPMDGPRSLGGHTILIRDGRIDWMGPDAEALVPPGVRVVDASGRWVVPGLADMHVHASAGDLALFVASGITTVREMNGTEAHLAMRDSIRAGARFGPSLIVTGPLVAGEEQRWRHALATTPEQGDALVRAHARAGYDAVKIYDGLSRETYEAIVAAAKAENIPIVGHVPRDVGLERVLEVGQRSIEHAGQIAHALPSADPDALSGVARRIAAAGAWVTPTLASEEALSRRGTPWYAERLARPESALVDAGLLDWWRSLQEPPADSLDVVRRSAYREGTQALVRALRDAGVPLLAGTDAPNPLMVPGTSLHDELAALVASGLSPYEAIRAATAEAARFSGAESEWGSIRVGARADLVVVDADPLEDVRALVRPWAVVLRGEWLSREELAKRSNEGLSARAEAGR